MVERGLGQVWTSGSTSKRSGGASVEAKMGLFVKGGISVFLTVINLGFSSRS